MNVAQRGKKKEKNWYTMKKGPKKRRDKKERKKGRQTLNVAQREKKYSQPKVFRNVKKNRRKIAG